MKTLLYRFKQKLKSKLKKPINYRKNFEEGYAEFEKTGHTTDEAYIAMLNLYCSTNGKFNEDFHQKIITTNPPKKVAQNIDGVIGNTSAKEFTNINSILTKDGYINFKERLNKQLISELYQFALKTETLTAPLYDKKVIFDPQKPISEIYRFQQHDLVNNNIIQQLIMDPTFINIARNYLGCEPIFDFPAMWWSTSFLKEASAEAAQLYHFDLDRIKWLKIFIYLNDVTLDNGPHRFIKGSHLVGAKPNDLLKRGYARIPDADLTKHYPPESFVVVTGEAGSIFAEDTKCWHKGTPLIGGNRLVLEFEYTSSMFGANYPKFEIENASSEFKEFCNNNKVYATNFKFKN